MVVIKGILAYFALMGIIILIIHIPMLPGILLVGVIVWLVYALCREWGSRPYPPCVPIDEKIKESEKLKFQ